MKKAKRSSDELRPEYRRSDFKSLVRGKYPARSYGPGSMSSATGSRERRSAAKFEMSLADYRELMRRVKDMDDPTRYMIVSALSPKMILYYDVSENVFCSEPSGRTMFKRKAHANAIAKQLDNDVQVVEAKVRKGRPIKVVSRIVFRFPSHRKGKAHRRRRA